ncbi:hypothetical protein ACSS6W_009949 [Trichoderma asperelloides]
MTLFRHSGREPEEPFYSQDQAAPASRVCDNCIRDPPSLDNLEHIELYDTLHGLIQNGGQFEEHQQSIERPSGPSISSEARITAEEEKYLLQEFWITIHHAIPLFSSPSSYADSTQSHDMARTISLLTAKLVQFSFTSIDATELESQIERLLSSGALQEELLGNSPSLDQLRKACLLSFYEFHQFPGQQAWMRIAKLVRIAYWIGLDRFDTKQRVFPDREGMTQEKIDDWRLLWWCIYRLDSYANLASGTPYMVEEGNIRTSLLKTATSRLQLAPEFATSKDPLFLPPSLNHLKSLLPAIASDLPETVDFNTHLLTVTAMRQVGRGLRQYLLNKYEGSKDRPKELQDQLSLLILSLPPHFLNPMRNALQNEMPMMHHARLVAILHLHMSKILIALLSCGQCAAGEEWLLAWQQVLETAENIATILAQWNPTYSLCVDPAICFIIFTALIFVHVHTKSDMVSSSYLSNYEHHESVLLVQLEHFARYWTLSRLLIRTLIPSYHIS